MSTDHKPINKKTVAVKPIPAEVSGIANIPAPIMVPATSKVLPTVLFILSSLDCNKNIYDNCILIFTLCKVGETKFFYKMYGRNDRTFPDKNSRQIN